MERIKIKLPEHFAFAASIAIRVTDLNYGGHVGNDGFLTLVHEARQQYLVHHGLTEMGFEGASLIITDAVIEFKRELNYGDNIKIHVVANGFEKYGFDIFYKIEIIKSNETILAGKAKTGLFCYDYANKKLVPVPEKAKEKLNTGL